MYLTKSNWSQSCATRGWILLVRHRSKDQRRKTHTKHQGAHYPPVTFRNHPDHQQYFSKGAEVLSKCILKSSGMKCFASTGSWGVFFFFLLLGIAIAGCETFGPDCVGEELCTHTHEPVRGSPDLQQGLRGTSAYWKFFESFSWHWTFDDIKQKTFFIFSVFKDLVICWRTEQGDMRENSRRLQPSEASLQNNALQRFTWTKNNTRNVSETVLVVSMFSLRTVKIWFSSRQAFQFQITRNQPKKNMFARSLPLFLRVKIVANQSCQVIMIEHSRNDSFSGWWWWWCPP